MGLSCRLRRKAKRTSDPNKSASRKLRASIAVRQSKASRAAPSLVATRTVVERCRRPLPDDPRSLRIVDQVCDPVANRVEHQAGIDSMWTMLLPGTALTTVESTMSSTARGINGYTLPPPPSKVQHCQLRGPDSLQFAVERNDSSHMSFKHLIAILPPLQPVPPSLRTPFLFTPPTRWNLDPHHLLHQ
jgi:hypothetical protein